MIAPWMFVPIPIHITIFLRAFFLISILYMSLYRLNRFRIHNTFDNVNKN